MPGIGLIGNITAGDPDEEGVVTLTYDAVDNATHYQIYVDNELDQTVEAPTLTADVTIARRFLYENKGKYDISYKALQSGQGESAFSSEIELYYPKFVNLSIATSLVTSFADKDYFVLKEEGVFFKLSSGFGIIKDFENAVFRWHFVRSILKLYHNQYVTIQSDNDEVYYFNIANVLDYSKSGSVIFVEFSDITLEVSCPNEISAEIAIRELDLAYNNWNLEDYKSGKTILEVGQGKEYTDVQDAIDDASSGNFIVVEEGTYGPIVGKNGVDIELKDEAIIYSDSTHCVNVPEGVAFNIFGNGQLVCESNDAYDCCIYAVEVASGNGSAELNAIVKSLIHEQGRCVAYMQGKLVLKCNSIYNADNSLCSWDWDDSAVYIAVDCLTCTSKNNNGIFVTYQDYEESVFSLKNCYLESRTATVMFSSNVSTQYSLWFINTVTVSNSNSIDGLIQCTDGTGFIARLHLWHSFLKSVNESPVFFTIGDDKLEIKRYSDIHAYIENDFTYVTLLGDGSINRTNFEMNP